MVTKALNRNDRIFLEKLGQKVRTQIIQVMGYSSLDAFALEHHELITKATLYQICDGKRDMKISTLRGLAKALKTTADQLISHL